MTMSEEEFAAKVEWEGSLFDALFEYGLDSSDVEEGKLQNILEVLEQYSTDFMAVYRELENYLDGLEIE